MSLQALPQAEQIRVQRLAEHLLGLGARAIAEALAEALAYGDVDRLMAYLRIPAGMLDFVQTATGMPGEFPPQFVTAPDDLTAKPSPMPGIATDREVA